LRIRNFIFTPFFLDTAALLRFVVVRFPFSSSLQTSIFGFALEAYLQF